MRIDLDNGILIEGDPDELRDLAGDLDRAAEEGHVEASMLTNDGVETVTIRRLALDEKNDR